MWIREAALDDPADAVALCAIIDGYASEAGGQSAPLSSEARAQLAVGLRAHGSALVLLAERDGRAVGAAVCFFGFSTFAGRPTLNIHDLAVLPGERGRGVGNALLDAVEERARARGCCKLTLEVHDTNVNAKRLYARRGFASFEEPTWFVSKRLD
jgi:ribosomal protein S18 acetylase RimI-like enzyme